MLFSASQTWCLLGTAALSLTSLPARIVRLILVLEDFGYSDWQLAALVCKVLWNLAADTDDAGQVFSDQQADQLAVVLDEYLGTYTDRRVPRYVHGPTSTSVRTRTDEYLSTYMDRRVPRYVHGPTSSSVRTRTDEFLGTYTERRVPQYVHGPTSTSVRTRTDEYLGTYTERRVPRYVCTLHGLTQPVLLACSKLTPATELGDHL